ncbi:AlpA family phage regulatory protein [Pseudomonas sp. CCC4.4]|uniref:helix-turn-helix transcriptional regulator n=1 Tax=Pseudomonas sp. CCC4.4 TaxID=3048612 RepID=UPI002B233BEE|nr:AlpA family phage regulatory protein [Pseudomonas sp. CCC4.4]MEB0169403.1 AlpA family phage regulatory protein [Pseudomonas sp. CCC4.4]
MNTEIAHQQDEEVEFIRLPDVRKITGLGPTKIYGMIKDGLFPAQIPLGGTAVGWVKSEVRAWCKHRIEMARNHPEAA